MNVAILCNGNSTNKPDRPELIESLQKNGHTVYLGGAMAKGINSYYKESGTRFLPIIASRSNTNPIKEISSIFSVAKKIRKENISAVIVYGVKNHAAMAIGAKLGGAKRIMCVVNGRGNLFTLEGKKGTLLRLIAIPMLFTAYQLSSSVCFQNSDDFDFFKKKHLVLSKKKMFKTWGSGVNPDKYPESAMPSANKFLFLSRITPTKGIYEYLEAAKIVKDKYPEVEFDVVGPIDNVIEKGCNDAIIEADNERIINYHGPTNDVLTWLSNCRFFVYPSYYPEGVPRSLLEAMSVGRPIITCNSIGCRETIDGNGYLVEPHSANEIADRMIVRRQIVGGGNC